MRMASGCWASAAGGALEHLGLGPDAVDVYIATFGKALGTAGAFVAGDKTLIEYLENSGPRADLLDRPVAGRIAEWTLGNLARLRGANPERRTRLADNYRTLSWRPAWTVMFHSPRRDTAIQIVHDRRQSTGHAIEQPNWPMPVSWSRRYGHRPVPTGTARLRITIVQRAISPKAN